MSRKIVHIYSKWQICFLWYGYMCTGIFHFSYFNFLDAQHSTRFIYIYFSMLLRKHQDGQFEVTEEKKFAHLQLVVLIFNWGSGTEKNLAK